MEKLAILLILVLIASGPVQGRMMMPNLLVKQLQMEKRMAMQDMTVKKNVNGCTELFEPCNISEIKCCPGLWCDGVCIPDSVDFE